MQVVEIFNSIQGEGPDTGAPVTFVRVAGCNLRCGWCDTKYALGGGVEMAPQELHGRIQLHRPAGSPVHYIVITGGEPMLYSEEFSQIKWLPDEYVAIETNGTIPRPLFPWFKYACVSPKLSSAGVGPVDLTILATWVHWARMTLKFVITKEDEVDQALGIVRLLGTGGLDVVFQPNGGCEDYQEALVELYMWVLRADMSGIRWKILPQLHVVMWGPNVRGV